MEKRKTSKGKGSSKPKKMNGKSYRNTTKAL